MMLAFDIETVSDESVIPLLPPCEAAGNLKDPEKIRASIAERTAARLSKLALDPDCCRIVAIGYTTPDGTIAVTTCADVEREANTIRLFWNQWGIVNHRPVGFNCVGFDLPVLIQRSRILGVTYPHVSIRKYGSPDCEDLMLDLSFGGLSDYHSLDFWCRRLNLDVPDDPYTGKDIAALVQADDWIGVEQHCRIDIAKTAALARRIYPALCRQEESF
jgi:hypothetical protein